jgi:hypothetical protein
VYFSKTCGENSSFIKIWQEWRVLYIKIYIHLWYHAEVFLEWEMFQTKDVEKIKTHILCSITFSRKSCRLWDNVEKSCRAGQATDDNVIQPTRCACWITKATNAQSEYVILFTFRWQQWLHEAVQCYVIRLHVLYLSGRKLQSFIFEHCY